MKKWYLINNSTPSMLGGFEDEYHSDFKEVAFRESLNTDVASTVILYNSDLSSKKSIRCIIQGNTADTQLKSIERACLFERNTVKAGMYIFFENRYWLITGYPGTNGIYEKATLSLCQYKLRWQNNDGKIIERWCNATSASKYDTGETANQVIKLSSNNFTLLIPDDEEGLELDEKRVFIDRKKENPTRVYKITRSDEILYDYGEHGGVLSFIASKAEFNPNTDNQELRICDYDPHLPNSSTLPPSNSGDVIIPPVKPTPPIATLPLTTIKGSKVLKCGYPRTYTVEFVDENENSVDWNEIDFSWKVVADFEVKQEVDGNKLTLFVDNEDLIGKDFVVQVIGDDGVMSEVTIHIQDIV